MLELRGGSTSVNGVGRGALSPPPRRLPWRESGRVDVEALVTWALRDQRVGHSATAGLLEAEARASGLRWSRVSSDGCAAVARIGAVGCRIDVSGPGRDAVHPAADAVALALDCAADGSLLRHYGRLGTRPDWSGPARWIIPERWVSEGEDAMWCYAERRTGAHCPIIIAYDAAMLDEDRAEYRRWWDGLEELAWQLSLRALGFMVDAPRVAREPWLDSAV